VFSPRLASSGTQAGGGVCPLKGGGRAFGPGCPGGGGGRGGLVLPRILVTCPGSQGTSCPCSLFMIRVEVPGSSFMLCLGPGPPSLLHLTRANAEKPYAGDTIPFLSIVCKVRGITFTTVLEFETMYGGKELRRNRVVVPARQATKAGGPTRFLIGC
jgi:hypothetical protein